MVGPSLFHHRAHLADDRFVDHDGWLAECARNQLEFAGALEHIEALQGAMHRRCEGQQPMVEQHHATAFLTTHAKRVALFLRGRHAVLVISQFVVDLHRVLADRAQSALEHGCAGTRAGMGMHGAIGIRASLVDRTVDREAGFVEAPLTADHLAVEIHLDQARRGDLMEHFLIVIDEEMVGFSRHAHRHMGGQNVGPAEVVADAIQRCKVAARLPFGARHFGFDFQVC